MRKVNWLIVGIMSFVIILILFGAGTLMDDWGFRGWGMMGPRGMMEDWGYPPTASPLSSVSLRWQDSVSSGWCEMSATPSRPLPNGNHELGTTCPESLKTSRARQFDRFGTGMRGFSD
jgi:hypothetical protein